MNSADNNAQFRGEPRAESSQLIRFAGSVLGAQRHVCAFFHSPDEEYRVLLPFIKEGFERGEKAFHIVDPKLRERTLTAVERPPASMWPRQNRAASSSCATGLMRICAMATSIRIGCLL